MEDMYALECAALEAEFQCTYADMDPALEGVTEQYRDTISQHVATLNSIDAQIREAVTESNKEKFVLLCKEGIKACDKFHDDMVKIPPDKLAGIKDLLPCFKILMKIATIVILLGGGKAISKTPQMKWIVSKLQTNNEFLAFVRDLFLTGKPVIRAMMGGENLPAPPSANEGKIRGAIRQAAPKISTGLNVLRNAKAILGIVNECNEQSKYAKMIREADQDSKGGREKKYNAVLGQIEEMKSAYQDMLNSADSIIISRIDAKAAQENFMSLAPYWAYAAESNGADPTEYRAAVEAEFVSQLAMSPAMELMLNNYDAVFKRNSDMIWDILSRMWEAQDHGLKSVADRYARQGIRSCDRFIHEIQNVPTEGLFAMKAVLNIMGAAEIIMSATTIRYHAYGAVHAWKFPDQLLIDSVTAGATIGAGVMSAEMWADEAARTVNGMDVGAKEAIRTAFSFFMTSDGNIDRETAEAARDEVIKCVTDFVADGRYEGIFTNITRLVTTRDVIGHAKIALKKLFDAITGAKRIIPAMLRHGLTPEQAQCTLMQRIGIVEALQLKKFFEEVLTIPENVVKACASDAEPSLDSMLTDMLRSAPRPTKIPDPSIQLKPAIEADTSWLFA